MKSEHPRGRAARALTLLAALGVASCSGVTEAPADEAGEGASHALLVGCLPGKVPAQCGRLPNVVDLRPQQTGFRSQGDRDTCSVFATTAAVEAAYKRQHGLELDLSEQYLHHMQKSFWLAYTTPLPHPEIQPENNGGGSVDWQFIALGRYGLPLETALPYIGAGSWQNLSGWTSPPGWIVILSQRNLDDFMLSAAPVTYLTPAPITATVLPQAALEGARYRPTRTRIATAAERTNLAWYQTELAAGREVAFQIELKGPDPDPGNDIREPGPNPGAVHAMLMVGYDNGRQAFMIKNSNSAAFEWMSYSFVTVGLVSSAGTILAVADPSTPFGTFENPQLFIGRWNLNHDGWPGTLDIYRLPGDGTPSSSDRRIGSYFGPDGIARRVNGKMTGNRIDFYIDWTEPNPSAFGFQGGKFTGYVFAKDRLAMAGSVLDPAGSTWAFTAFKGRTLTGVTGSATLAAAAYWGSWQLDTDGTRGTLNLSADPATRVISGSFADDTGAVFTVAGQIEPDPRGFHFTIQSPMAPTYTGHLNGHQLGVMSGASVSSGVTVGFYAVRLGNIPLALAPGAGGAQPAPPPTDPFVCGLMPHLPRCP